MRNTQKSRFVPARFVFHRLGNSGLGWSASLCSSTFSVGAGGRDILLGGEAIEFLGFLFECFRGFVYWCSG